MSHGFIKLNREKGRELLEGDPKAYLLLSQIAIRARRKDSEYSRIFLKANQAFIGDHEKIGLSRQEYRTAKKKLTEYGLVVFQPTNKGTIATMTSIAIFDINAEEIDSSEQPAASSIKNQNNQPTDTKPTSLNYPNNLQQSDNSPPLTRKEKRKEYKNTTTSVDSGVVSLYECLEQLPNLSAEEKTSLMKYPEDRVEKAIKWTSKATIKTSLIQTIHWHCRQPSPPQLQLSPSGQNEQQAAAREYNLFLQDHGHESLALKNETAIPQNYAHIFLNGHATTISLKNTIEIIKVDFKNSREEILERARVKYDIK